VIDLRVAAPARRRTIIASVAKTRRAVVVDEGWKTGSISARDRRGSWTGLLVARRAAGPGLQRGSADPLSQASGTGAIPQVPRIVAAAKRRAATGAEAMGVFVMPSLGADMEAGTLVEWLEARRHGQARRRGRGGRDPEGRDRDRVFEDGPHGCGRRSLAVDH
jgi:hypothetical protein